MAIETYEWKYELMENRSLYQLHFQTQSPLVAYNKPGRSKGQSPLLRGQSGPPVKQVLGERDREVYRVGDWLVESKQRPYGLEVLLRRPGGNSPLELSLLSGTATANIRLLRSSMSERTCKKLKKLVIDADSIEMEMEGDSKPAPTPDPAPKASMTDEETAAALLADPEARKLLDEMVDGGLFGESDRAMLEGMAEKGKASGKSIEDLPPEVIQERLKELVKKEGFRKGKGRRPSPKPAQEQQAQMALELQEARKQAEAAKAQAMALEQSVAQLNERLESERKRNTDLQLAASVHLTELLAALGPHREALASSMQAQLDRAVEAEASLKEAEAQSEAARQRAEAVERQLAEKQAEIEKYRSLETLRTLDCGQLEKELDGLRSQLEADGYSLALLEEEAFFDVRTMQKQMEDTKKQLEALEEQFAKAVRQRERIDGMIQDAALKGSGVISLKKELG